MEAVYILLIFVLMYICGSVTISSVYGDEDANIKEEELDDGKKE